MKNFSHNKGKILLMEDEKLIRIAVLKMLEEAGYEGYETINGEEAIENYREAQECGCPFDAVLMDLNITNGMGGKAAIRSLLEIDAGARVILASADAISPVVKLFKNHGFRGVLIKPFSSEELYHTLHKVIDER